MSNTDIAVQAYERWSGQFDHDEKALAEWFYERFFAYKDIPPPVDTAVEIPANYESHRRGISLLKARKMLNALRDVAKPDPDPNFKPAASTPASETEEANND